MINDNDDSEFDFFDSKAALAICAAAVSLMGTGAPLRCRTSELSGHAYVQEHLNGHPGRFLDVLRMPKETFLALRDLTIERGLLAPTRKGFTVEEQLAIFLFIVSHAASNRLAVTGKART
jgi:hypothetical protein